MNEHQKKIVEDLINELEGWTVDERHELQVELNEIFCEHCGIKHAGWSRRCQCWNDE